MLESDTSPMMRRAAGALALGASLLLAACAGAGPGSRQFDVDAFLRAPDTALPEVLGNQDFLSATRATATDCAVMLQSTQTGVLESLPSNGGGRGPAWLLHPAGSPDKVWLVVSGARGDRSCHGPLPADEMKALVARTKR